MKKIFFLLSLVLVGFTSCNREEDDLFSQSSAQRAKAAIAEDLKVLTSAENGWLMKYYPSSELEYGGYNVALKFSEDGTVAVASDVYNPADTAVSLFRLTQSAGIVLSFDTYNEVFHLFSDPSAPLAGDKGEGLSGDYDFSIISAAADEVILKGKKTGNYAVLTPINGNWEPLFDELAAVDDSLYGDAYTLLVDTVEVEVDASFRTFTFSYMEGRELREVTASYVVNQDGISFYEPVTVLGHTFEGFSLSAGDTLAAIGDNHVSLVKFLLPLSGKLLNGEWFFHLDYISKGAQPYFKMYGQAAAGFGLTCYYLYLGSGTWGYGLYSNCSGYAFMMGFDAEAVDDNTVTLSFNNTYDEYGNGSLLYQYGANYTCKKLSQTFTLEGNDDLRPDVIKMTSEAGDVIYVTSSVAIYPFGQ